jgi:uncharacterized YccA/Bax inhibitor family protein
MRTANPALNERYFEAEAIDAPRTNVMTVNGTVIRVGVLAAILIAAGGLAWSLVNPAGLQGAPDPTFRLIFGPGALILGFIFALVTIFVPRAAPITAPIYAALKGLFLGTISSFFAAQYQGIVLQAAMLTVGVLLVMLFAYGSGVIRVTDKFRLGIIAATGAVFLIYLATFILGFFGVAIPYIHGAGPIGIGFSVIVVIIAALNLALDFDIIESGARYGAPKYMEWYAAFGLIVTLVWLYIEILRLLAKLRSGE